MREYPAYLLNLHAALGYIRVVSDEAPYAGAGLGAAGGEVLVHPLSETCHALPPVAVRVTLHAVEHVVAHAREGGQHRAGQVGNVTAPEEG